MFHKRDRIIKKDGEKPTDLEEEVAKHLHSLSAKHETLHSNLKIIFLNSAKYVEYTQRDGSSDQYLLVRIPHRSLGAFKKVGAIVQQELEQKFSKKVPNRRWHFFPQIFQIGPSFPAARWQTSAFALFDMEEGRKGAGPEPSDEGMV